ncbi:MAG: DUF4383 domain-containing protein [Verrucomicrobia subdivision 3 bacterium]|nr:DUF4383 domain-containing protein [Limisphaerales bacterium]
MAKTMCVILGALFLVVGLAGFAAPDALGMHLSTAHNVVHLVSGALALYIGLAGTYAAARSFCILFGVIYGLLGILGFLMGSPGPEKMLTVIPDQLVLGRMDHIVHVLLAALFLIGGLVRQPAMTAAAPRAPDREPEP